MLTCLKISPTSAFTLASRTERVVGCWLRRPVERRSLNSASAEELPNLALLLGGCNLLPPGVYISDLGVPLPENALRPAFGVRCEEGGGEHSTDGTGVNRRETGVGASDLDRQRNEITVR